MPLRIRVSNGNRRRGIDRKGIEKAARLVIASFGKKDALIDITFVTDRGITRLNRSYRGRDRTTDVLAFSLHQRSGGRIRKLIGDIYISSDTASRNARRFGTDVQKELLRYTIHGVLHLFGVTDATAGEKRKMKRLEERFLTRLVK